MLKAIACVHPKFFIGCRAGKTTQFAVLDIDQKSQYHNQRALGKVLQVLSEAGLTRSSLYRSSYSGGWHLYIFFDEPINSADLRKQLVKVLMLNDFHISKGQLEIFPHPGVEGSQGLGLRLPLQQGWAWLDKKTLEVEHDRSELSATKALELFIDVLDGDANSYAAFRQLKLHAQELETRREVAGVHGLGRSESNVIPIRRTEAPKPGEFTDFLRAVFHKLPPGIIVDNWYKGRIYHLNGLTGPSQRAEAIECVGHYLFYGDPSRDLPALGYGYEQEREWAIRELLSARHNGQSADINRGRADAMAQVERAANWRPAHKKDTDTLKYAPERPISWIRENANRKTGARKRIADALKGVKKLRRSFTTVELQQAAGCSRETLYNHADIWRQDYEDLAEGFFAICTDEYNVVVGGAPLETIPQPGFVAACSVASEISMHTERQQRQEQKAVAWFKEDSEKNWVADVTRLTENEPSRLSVHELKALLTVLLSYLAMAPSYESQSFIQEHINQIREQHSKASEKPLFVVRPP